MNCKLDFSSPLSLQETEHKHLMLPWLLELIKSIYINYIDLYEGLRWSVKRRGYNKQFMNQAYSYQHNINTQDRIKSSCV